MNKITFRTVMVVGNNPDELIRKYDLDTKVEPYIKMKKSEAENARQKHLKYLQAVIDNMSDHPKEILNNMFMDIMDMDSDEYFEEITSGCSYDEETGDAISTVNPNAHYKHAVNPQKRLDATNEESDFINPFILLPEEGEEEGEAISYVATKGEVDWKRMHMWNTELYERAWELCVNDDDPKNEQEQTIKKNMSQRTTYFDNFASKEEYVMHSCSFWCYGYIDENGYTDIDDFSSDKEWVKNFYEKFVEPLDDNTQLSLYFVRSID